MSIESVDLVGLVAVVMVFSIVLIPVMGLTARFALKPTVEALSQFFQKKGEQDTVLLLERRIALLEQQLESVEVNVRSIEEGRTFDRQLRAADPSEPGG